MKVTRAPRHGSGPLAGNTRFRAVLLCTVVLSLGVVIGAVAQELWSRSARPETPTHFAAKTKSAPLAAAVERPGPSPAERPGATLPEQAKEAGADSSGTIMASSQPPDQRASLDTRLAELTRELARLTQRVSELERAGVPADGDVHSDPAHSPEQQTVLPLDTPEAKRIALVSAGVTAEQADDIVQRQSQLEMARLELRDRAAREGWADSERFRQALSDLGDDELNLRDEVGETAFDLYLFNTGVPNRVQVTAVVQGSAAERNGVIPGDVIEAYADGRVFSAHELREATTSGERDEEIPILIRRGETVLEAWLPRGPIGIHLTPVRVAPGY